jgi:hypothetical protein
MKTYYKQLLLPDLAKFAVLMAAAWPRVQKRSNIKKKI